MKSKIVLVLLGLFFISTACFAQQDFTEEDTSPATTNVPLIETIKYLFMDSDKDLFFAYLWGYDTNVYLDHDKEYGDVFQQMFLEPTLSYPIDGQLTVKAGYELMTLFYIAEEQVSFIRNGIRLGAAYDINEDLDLTADYRWGATEYLHGEENDFFDHKLKTRLRHALPFEEAPFTNMYHALSHEVMFKDYAARHTRTATAALDNARREDWRNTVEYEIGKFFPKDLFKVKIQYYFNNSSEMYLHFYDYDSFKTTVSLTHLFTDDIFGYVSFSRQRRDFRSRSITADTASLEWDRTYVVTTGVYYNMTKNLSLVANYTYRQNWSNEPAQEYEGSLFSWGINYLF